MTLRRAVVAVVLVLLVGALCAAYVAGVLVGSARSEAAHFVLDIADRYDLCPADLCAYDDTRTRLEKLCDPFREGFPERLARPAVLLVLGQSNAGNHGEGLYRAGDAVLNFNPQDGRCYSAYDPLLGATGRTGSPWGRLGDRLVASGDYDGVLIVPLAVAGSRIREWAPGGDLHARLPEAKQRLDRAGIRVTHILWQQGESDRGSSHVKQYRERFQSLLASLRALGLGAPIFASVSTRCIAGDNPELRAVQLALPEIEGVFAGANTDTLTGPKLRRDSCHFTREGLEAHAQLWEDALLAPPL